MAALVTFVTMGRFVEEERGKIGIFNALGYSSPRIIHKFVIYGLITSITGTTAGVITGHTLLRILIHNTYKSDLQLPAFELHFYLGLTLCGLPFRSLICCATCLCGCQERALGKAFPTPPSKTTSCRS